MTLAEELEVAALADLPAAVPGRHLDRSTPASIEFEQILALEDLWGGRDVFINPHTGRRCHSGSYGTIFGFAAFERAVKDIGLDRFSYHDWRRVVAYYRHNWYLSPVYGMLAASLARLVGLPDPLVKDEATAAFYEAGPEEMPEPPAC